MPDSTLVSVIIPTFGRPQLVLRAVRSVFAQTHGDIEAIVVVDGPDEETVAALATAADSRLQVIVNPRSLTAAGARNVGVAAARGAWIAFLDDDDEWMPHKIATQFATAAGRDTVLVSCLSEVVTPSATYVWPTKLYDNSEPLDIYLFDRRTTFAGAAFIQTSSFFLARALFNRAPFHTDTPHDDWDFILRLTKECGATIEAVPEVLLRIYFEEARPSLTKAGTWRLSLDWLDRIRGLLTRRGYSGICLGIVGPRAAQERAYGAFFLLLFKAFTRGSPRPLSLAAFVAFWVLPQPVRRQLRARFTGRKA